MSFHKKEALSLNEIQDVWQMLKKTPRFEMLNCELFNQHCFDKSGFNKYLFWEDIIGLASESFNERS